MHIYREIEKECTNLLKAWAVFMATVGKEKRRKWIETFGLIAALFLMLAVHWNRTIFASDEAEIFLKGNAIAQGRLLYLEIGSQHMPIMYYISAFFSMLGVSTNVGLRLCFYFLTACLWGLIYYRYEAEVGKRVVVLSPVLYIVTISMISMGYAILSEQLVAISMVILLFELLRFQRTNVLKLDSCVMISLAIFLSFGSAFVSIFSIFAVALTVLMMEIRTCVKEKTGVAKAFLYLVRRYWKLVLIVALPFAILCGYYYATGSLRAFYGWAYYLNRVIYPHYYGYGTNILNSMFSGLYEFGQSFSVENLSVSSIAWLLLFYLTLTALLQIHRSRRDPILTGGLVFLLIAAATRGVFNFHGLAAVALICVFSAMSLDALWKRLRCAECPAWKHGIVILCALMFSGSYLSLLPQLFLLDLSPELDENSTTYCLDQITEHGERVGMGVMANDVLVDAGVIPAMVTGGSCAWMWEYGGAQAMEELQANPPRVFVFSPDISTWGYALSDYAPELLEYVEDNYMAMTVIDQPMLYVRNDYYNEACAILKTDSLLMPGPMDGVTPQIMGDMVVKQTFPVDEDCTISSLEVTVDTYERENTCVLHVVLTDETAGTEHELADIDCATMEDNAAYTVTFEPQDLLKDHTYSLSFSADGGDENNSISICYYDMNNITSTDGVQSAQINGETQQYILCIQLRKDSDE